MSAELRKKRSDWDFSKYQLDVSKSDVCLIHTLHNNGSMSGRVVFINSNGIMAVTGDFYNWIFSREFHPSKDGYVSDGYWAEKLQIASDINPFVFSPDDTLKELKNGIDGELEEYGYEGEELEKMKEYYEECIEFCENYSDGESYLHEAHNNLPNFCDYEAVVYCSEIKNQLKIIFDAFEEICSRM